MPTKTKASKKPLAYKRVPVTDVIMDDEEMPRNPSQRYDWVALGDKAVALHKAKPGAWQLVDEAGATSTASNITTGLIQALKSSRFSGWKFRGRCSEITMVTEPGRPEPRRVAKIWIRAEPEELVL